MIKKYLRDIIRYLTYHSHLKGENAYRNRISGTEVESDGFQTLLR